MRPNSGQVCNRYSNIGIHFFTLLNMLCWKAYCHGSPVPTQGQTFYVIVLNAHNSKCEVNYFIDCFYKCGITTGQLSKHGLGFDFLILMALSIKSFQMDTCVLFLGFTGRRKQNYHLPLYLSIQVLPTILLKSLRKLFSCFNKPTKHIQTNSLKENLSQSNSHSPSQ